MTQERRLHHAVLICITVMEQGNWASSSRLHLHLVTEEEEVPSSDSGHTCPICVVTRTEDQEQWVAVLHWRLCIMFSSTLAINLVAEAEVYFLSGVAGCRGRLATGRTQKIVSSAAAPHLGDPSGAGRGGCAAAVISARHGAAK